MSALSANTRRQPQRNCTSVAKQADSSQQAQPTRTPLGNNESEGRGVRVESACPEITVTGISSSGEAIHMATSSDYLVLSSASFGIAAAVLAGAADLAGSGVGVAAVLGAVGAGRLAR